jgi:uncharacterized protein (UPF0335 family)
MPEQRDDDGRLQGVLDEIIRLEEERSDIAADLKGVESRLSVLKDTAAREISDRMAGLGDPSVTHGGRKFTAKMETAVSIRADQKRAVLEACEKIGLDVLQISQPRVQSYVREQGGEGDGKLSDGTILEGLVEEFTRPVLRMSRT